LYPNVKEENLHDPRLRKSFLEIVHLVFLTLNFELELRYLLAAFIPFPLHRQNLLLKLALLLMQILSCCAYKNGTGSFF